MDAALLVVESSLSIISLIRSAVEADSSNLPTLNRIQTRLTRIKQSFTFIPGDTDDADFLSDVHLRLDDRLSRLEDALRSAESAISQPHIPRFFSANSVANDLTEALQEANEIERHMDFLGLLAEQRARASSEVRFVKNKLEELNELMSERDRTFASFYSNAKQLIESYMAALRGQGTVTGPVFDAESSSIVPPLTMKRWRGTTYPESIPERLPDSVDTWDSDAISILSSVPERTVEMYRLLDQTSLSIREKSELHSSIDNLFTRWRIPLSDIKINRASDPYGDGTFSTVYRAQFTLRFRDERGVAEARTIRVAAKELKIPIEQFNLFKADIYREMCLLTELSHPCILRTYGAYWPDETRMNSDVLSGDSDSDEEREEVSEVHGRRPIVVMERMSLHLCKAKQAGLIQDATIRRRILVDITKGLRYLHANNIVHRDIKPENILLQVRNSNILLPAKISDFGLSRAVHWSKVFSANTHSKPVGTIFYMPPEVLSDSTGGIEQTRVSWDIWSLGLVMCFLCGDDALAIEHSPLQACMYAASGDLTKDAQRWAGSISDLRVRNAAICCLEESWEKRATIDEVLEELRQSRPEVVPYLRGKRFFLEAVQRRVFSCEKAKKEFETAFENGHKASGAWFARCAQNESFGAMVSAWRRGHSEGDAGCTVRLGWHLASRSSSENERGLGIRLLRQARDGRNSLALFYLYEAVSRRITSHDVAGTNEGSLAEFEQTARLEQERFVGDELHRGDLLLCLGMCRRDGRIQRPDYGESARLFAEAAQLGNSEALCELSRAYREGKGVRKDLERAYGSAVLARNAGSPEGYAALATLLLGEDRMRDVDMAASLLKEGTSFGSSEAEFYYGLCLYYGTGVHRQHRAGAANMFEKSAAKGHAEATFYLGVCSLNGVSRSRGKDEALGIFKQAQELGCCKAMWKMSYCYEHGLGGVERDTEEALRLLKEGARAKSADAMIALGDAFLRGSLMRKNEEKAAMMYMATVELTNNVTAKKRLGDCYQAGKGVRQSTQRAVDMYRETVFESDHRGR